MLFFNEKSHGQAHQVHNFVCDRDSQGGNIRQQSRQAIQLFV